MMRHCLGGTVTVNYPPIQRAWGVPISRWECLHRMLNTLVVLLTLLNGEYFDKRNQQIESSSL